MKVQAFPKLCVLLAVLAALASRADAQDRDESQPDDIQVRTHAIAQSESRAEREAIQLVSLPADKIIVLLQQEPGLFLEVKKMLVRQAYAQGRILDAQELEDEAIFRLIRNDQETRSLITQQIVDRGYIRAKPTREELAREYEEQQKLERQNSQDQAYKQEFASTPEPQNQYPGTPAGRTPQTLPVYPQNNSPQPTPQPASPQTPLNTNQSRALMQASLSNSGQDVTSGGLPLDAVTGGGQQQLSPEQIQQLVSAYSTGQLSSGGQSPDLSKLAGVMGSRGGASTDVTKQPQSQEDAYVLQRSPEILPQQASLQMPRQRRHAVPEDRPALLHQANPYADVPSLYDLYSQYSSRPTILQRFGLDIFENGTGNLDQLPMDLPAGPDYVLGPGDGLSIDLWGSVSQRLHRVVDSGGGLSLPEVGVVQVSGHNLADVQHMVQAALRSQYRELDADVSLDRLRTIRVYVVGDAQRPGAYEVSSLSTPLNALYEAGGPSSKGSMRIVKHFRGNQLIENVDLYDLLLRGVQAETQRLESGDTILVPPIGQEITIEGMVRRPAIYELAGEKSLAEVLELAGGVLPAGALRHVDVERVEAHQSRSMLRLDIPESDAAGSKDDAAVTQALENFQIQDGDKIKISPILPFSDKTVFLDGHVFRPGKYAYREGMKITDLIHNYNDLLPEPYKRHAEIIRLNAPDFKPQVIAFNLDDALAGKTDLTLKAFDTVRIFGRFDFEDPPIITISGEVRDPGDHITNGATYLRDAIFLAGNTSPDAELDDVQVFRKTSDGKMQVISADLRQAIAGDPKANLLLEPQDRIFVHKDLSRLDPPTVEVEGEVARPGKYPLGADMTAAELVKVAGGLKRSAYVQEAELTRYTIEHGEKFESEHLPIPIGEALSGQPDTDRRLCAGDVLTIRQIAGWKDIGATVKIDGEVVHPGTYGVQEGERLSDVLARAGGLRSDAYPYGAIFERLQVRELEEKNRAQLIAQAQQEGGGLGAGLDDPLAKEASVAQWRDTLNKLQNTPPVGRLVIHISSGKTWMHSPADIQLRGGDSIYIPKKPNFVMVQGAVYNQTGIAFRPGKSAHWYLHQAGGPTSAADRKNVFIVRADGTVAGGPKGLFTGGALDSAMQPGDMIVVPSKAFGGGFKWKETLEVAQLVSAVGIAVQVARGF